MMSLVVVVVSSCCGTSWAATAGRPTAGRNFLESAAFVTVPNMYRTRYMYSLYHRRIVPFSVTRCTLRTDNI